MNRSRDHIIDGYYKTCLKYLNDMVEIALQEKSQAKHLLALRKCLDKIVIRHDNSTLIQYKQGIDPTDILHEIKKLANETQDQASKKIKLGNMSILYSAIECIDTEDPSGTADKLLESSDKIKKNGKSEIYTSINPMFSYQNKLLFAIYHNIMEAYENEVKLNPKNVPPGLLSMRQLLSKYVDSESISAKQVVLRGDIAINEVLAEVQSKAVEVSEKYPDSNMQGSMHLLYEAIKPLSWESDEIANQSYKKIKGISKVQNEFIAGSLDKSKEIIIRTQRDQLDNISRLITALLNDEKRRGKWRSRGLVTMQRLLDKHKQNPGGQSYMRYWRLSVNPSDVLGQLKKIAQKRLQHHYPLQRSENKRDLLYNFLSEMNVTEVSTNNAKFTDVSNQIRNKIVENEKLPKKSFKDFFMTFRKSKSHSDDNDVDKTPRSKKGNYGIF